MRSVTRTVCTATAAACLPAIDANLAHYADAVPAESAAPLHPTALGTRANGTRRVDVDSIRMRSSLAD